MIVEDGWARALMGALDPPAGGAGGPSGSIAPDAGPVDWAVFFLRYSAFLASGWTDGPTSGELAGDNAAYRREDLERHRATFERGFWEVDFHRCLRADGLILRRVAAARAALGRSFGLRMFLRQRYAHGREFGLTDVRAGRRGRAAIVLKAPAVPLAIAWRAGRRVGVGEDTWRFAAALPIVLLFASAWAAGEAAGALPAAGAAA